MRASATHRLMTVTALGWLAVGPALAQTSPGPNTTGGMKLGQAECEATWNRLGGAATESLTSVQSETSLSDFKKADINNDGRLSRTEFQLACDTGLVRSSAATGRGSGTEMPATKN